MNIAVDQWFHDRLNLISTTLSRWRHGFEYRRGALKIWHKSFVYKDSRVDVQFQRWLLVLEAAKER
jgi:hypothetical protein